MKRITKKFYLEVENYENPMLNKMQITEKEFVRQLKFLTNIVNITENKEDQDALEKRIRIYDHGNFTETVYYFTNCCCDTILVKYECKKGFSFVKEEK